MESCAFACPNPRSLRVACLHTLALPNCVRSHDLIIDLSVRFPSGVCEHECSAGASVADRLVKRGSVNSHVHFAKWCP